MEVNNVNGAQNVYQTTETGDVKKAYQPQVDLSDPVDDVQFSTKEAAPKKEASTAKKVGVGLSSVLISGLGQFINGDVKSGIKHLAGTYGISALGAVVGGTVAAVCPPLGIAIGAASGLTSFGIQIHSIVDAVKNA